MEKHRSIKNHSSMEKHRSGEKHCGVPVRELLRKGRFVPEYTTAGGSFAVKRVTDRKENSRKKEREHDTPMSGHALFLQLTNWNWLVFIVLCSVSRSFQCNGIDCIYLYRRTLCYVAVVIDYNFIADAEMGLAILILNIQRYPVFTIFVFYQNGILIIIVDNARDAWLILNNVVHTSVIATDQGDHANQCENERYKLFHAIILLVKIEYIVPLNN